MFLACLVDGAFDIFDAFSFREGEDPEDIDGVLGKFEQFCVGEANEIYGTFLLNERNQEEGETIDTYVTSLQKLTKGQDSFVLGVRDDSLSETSRR